MESAIADCCNKFDKFTNLWAQKIITIIFLSDKFGATKFGSTRERGDPGPPLMVSPVAGLCDHHGRLLTDPEERPRPGVDWKSKPQNKVNFNF